MQARQLPARNGSQWLLSGLRLFRSNPALVSALTFTYLVVILVLVSVPYVGQLLLPPLLPVMSLIVANGCRAIALGGPRTVQELLLGCKQNRTALVRLGALQLISSLVLMSVVFVLGIEVDQTQPLESLQGLLIVFALSLPLMLGFLYAPLLAGWHGLPAVKSVFFSLAACLRNWRALLMFGLTLFASCVLLPTLLIAEANAVSASFGQALELATELLLLVVMLPAVNSVPYIGYREIFADD